MYEYMYWAKACASYMLRLACMSELSKDMYKIHAKIGMYVCTFLGTCLHQLVVSTEWLLHTDLQLAHQCFVQVRGQHIVQIGQSEVCAGWTFRFVAFIIIKVWRSSTKISWDHMNWLTDWLTWVCLVLITLVVVVYH